MDTEVDQRQPPPADNSDTRRHVCIDLARLHRMGLVTQDADRTAIAESFRVIKRPLLRKAFGKGKQAGAHHNLIVITSALPHEGKTFCAINLAMSIAMERDHTVLLVDTDVGGPSVLRMLGLPDQPGLMNRLLDEQLPLSELILSTNIDGLRLLPAGRCNQHATELLASQAMSALLDEIASRYPDRIVIFDSPPLLLTTEASVLAAQMGQVVVVVEAETTTEGTVREALRRIEPCPHVSLICNKTRSFPGSDEYHGHYD